jgi:hypothetical protein
MDKIIYDSLDPCEADAHLDRQATLNLQNDKNARILAGLLLANSYEDPLPDAPISHHSAPAAISRHFISGTSKHSDVLETTEYTDATTNNRISLVSQSHVQSAELIGSHSTLMQAISSTSIQAHAFQLELG